MSKIDGISQSNDYIYENKIKNDLYNLYLLINPKISGKNEINLSKSTTEDIITILKTSIQSLLTTINNNNYTIIQMENNIVKLESDVRNFIKREFQNKIQKDALEMKIKAYMCIEEEYEILKEKVRYDGGKFLNNDRKDNEIIILRQENSLLKKDITKYEQKNKDLTDIVRKDQDIIKVLKSKNTQLNKLINELKSIKNNSNIHNIHNNSSINLNIINNNNGNKNNSIINNSNKKFYNMNLTKRYFETLNKNCKNNLQFKQKLTLYHSPKITYQFEPNNKNKNENNNKKNKIITTIDNNKLFISSYNKIFNNNTTNNKNRNKKFKGSSISMRLDDNEKSDIINKYLSNNNSNSKYMSSIKTKSYNKISKSIPKYKVPLTNKNESFINNYGGNIRHSMSKKTFRKENHFNEHASFVVKRVIKK